MTYPIEVTVVRDTTNTVLYVASVLDTALRSWLVMLLVPVFTTFTLSYVESVAATVVAGLLFKDASYVWWSRRKR